MVSWVTFGSFGVLLAILRIPEARSEKINYPEEIGHVFTTIFHKYSERVRPYNHNRDPLDMSVILNIVHVNDLDLVTQELDVTMDLSITWTDTRLSWFFDTVDYIEVNQSSVWTPDVTFLDAMSRTDVLINPRYLVVLRNGKIVWYRRIRAHILCEVNQTASTQECNIRMGSKQFPESELAFKEGKCNMRSSFENVNWEITSVNNTMDISSIPLPTKLAFPTGKMSLAQCSLSIEVKNTDQETSVASELQGKDPDDPENGTSRTSLDLLVLVCSLIGLYMYV